MIYGFNGRAFLSWGIKAIFGEAAEVSTAEGVYTEYATAFVPGCDYASGISHVLYAGTFQLGAEHCEGVPL